MAETAGAFLDVENLFHWRHFEVDHEYAAASGDDIVGDTVLQEHDPATYPELNKAVAKHPGLAVVPKYVDLLVAWFGRSYQVEARRTFGKKWDPGVRASRERFQAHGFGFTPADNVSDAADTRLLLALREATSAGRFPVYVVGSSDAKPAHGVIVKALELVDLSRRVRPDGSRLVVVLGPRYSSPSGRRWGSQEDLGSADEVFLLSRIVHNEIRDRRTNPFRTPRADLPPVPPPSQVSRRRWRARVARWESSGDASVELEMRASFRGASRQPGLSRSFENLDWVLTTCSPAARARLRTMAGRIVNDLVEALPPPEVEAGIATFPIPRHRP